MRGPKEFGKLPQANKDEYTNMIKDMRDEVISKEAMKTLMRTWENTFAFLSTYAKEDKQLKLLFQQGDLPQLSKFEYYQAYARVILRLDANPLDIFTSNVGRFLSVLSELYESYKSSIWIPSEADVIQEPCITTIRIIASILKESKRVLAKLPQASCQSEDITAAVTKARLCTVIVKTGDDLYLVCANGVPFITGLSEKQAALVFATASDIFNYNAKKPTNKEESEKIGDTIDFLRKIMLAITDLRFEKQENEFNKLVTRYSILLLHKQQSCDDFSISEGQQKAIKFLQKLVK